MGRWRDTIHLLAMLGSVSTTSGLVLVGLYQIVIAIVDWFFLNSEDLEALSACIENTHLDCSPEGWSVRLAVGVALVVHGLVVFTALATRRVGGDGGLATAPN
jgi:hypothetical protein